MGKFRTIGDLEVTFFVKPEAALALAQLLKRIDYETIKTFTLNASELELAKEGLSDLCWGLAEAGGSPR